MSRPRSEVSRIWCCIGAAAWLLSSCASSRDGSGGGKSGALLPNAGDAAPATAGAGGNTSPAGHAGMMGSAGRGTDPDDVSGRTGAGVSTGAPEGPDAADCAARDAEPAAATELTQLETLLEFDPALQPDSTAIGESLALEGDSLAIGAPRQVSAGAQGTVLVYTGDGGHWSMQAMLQPPENLADGGFGRSLALSGDTLAVGAPEDWSAVGIPPPGRIDLFVRNADGWRHQTSLNAEHPAERDTFGAVLALDGDTLVTSAVAESRSTVEVFQRSGADWQRVQVLEPIEPIDGYGFGASLALDGDTLAVGVTPAVYDPRQAVHIFVRREGRWEASAVLAGSQPGELFAAAIALQGDLLVAGDSWQGGPDMIAEGPELPEGAAYVFERDCDGTWTQTALLKASPETRGSAFGAAVAIDGERIVVSCHGDSTAAQGIDGAIGTPAFEDDYTGAVYVFGRTAAGYAQLDYLKSTTPVAREQRFGWAISADAGRVAVASRAEDSVHVFH